jgi:hypothetical protein
LRVRIKQKGGGKGDLPLWSWDLHFLPPIDIGPSGLGPSDFRTYTSSNPALKTGSYTFSFSDSQAFGLRLNYIPVFLVLQLADRIF